ncbi:MAG: hypothetical protein R6W67_00940 [Bacteroidales bacterium]
MNRRFGAILAIIVIVIFAAFIVWDITSGSLFSDKKPVETTIAITYPEPAWQLSRTHDFPGAKLKAIAVAPDGRIAVGGEYFLTILDSGLNILWDTDSYESIEAIAIHGNIVYAATESTIMLYTLAGDFITEWGPYEDNSLITSLSANDNHVAVADAAYRRVWILSLDGSLTNFFGHEGEKFIIPSPCFDIHIKPDNTILVVNPGKQRIETRDLKGNIISSFGEPGLAPEAFSGCCNPSHFAMIDENQVVTSEKGVSRIKVMKTTGELMEYVATPDLLSSSKTLDLAASGDTIIYAASPAESKLYIFTRN